MTDKERGYSLKNRLIKQLLGSFVIITILSLFGIYLDTRHEVEELFDASLAQTSRVLLGLLHPETIKQNNDSLHKSLDIHDIDFDIFDEEATPYGHKYEKKLAFQVWENKQNLLLKSSSIDIKPMAPLNPGFSYVTIEDYRWRTFCLYSEHSKVWLIVGERDDIRGELTHDIAFNHILPVIFILPFLAGVIWLTISKAIHPLQSLVNHVDKQNYHQLESVDKKNWPYEVNILTRAMNHLFQRLNQSYQREKRFTSDVAHELRNPLAALSVHNDNAIAENNDSGITDILVNMRRGIGRLSHLVAQLLALSRADREVQADEFSKVDLLSICQQLQQQFEFQAEIKEQKLSFQLPDEPIEISAIEVLLSSMIANLIDNALRYSPPGSSVQVICEHNAELTKVIVEDSGQGIGDELKARVMDRFYRIPGSRATGSGLGLSIVKRIAEIHHVDLQLLDSPDGGLKVQLIFSFSH